jgi:hypothetical protein
MSNDPPAGAGATSVMMPDGQFVWARAMAGAASAPSKTERRVNRGIIPLLVLIIVDVQLSSSVQRLR